MNDKIHILVGTMTGTAELVAEEILDTLSDKGADVEMTLMDDVRADTVEGAQTVIICTSTYGQGDVPDNAQAFLESLQASKPDLSTLRYGVFALGDMTYAQTFCFGGKQFDKTMQELGAQRVGDMLLHDASSGSLPEDEAADWATDWYENLAA